MAESPYHSPMRMKLISSMAAVVSLSALCSGCGKPASAWETSGLPALRAQAAFPTLKFDKPLFLTHAPGFPSRIYVCEQGGRVWAFENKPGLKADERRLVLDLGDVVLAPGNKTHPGGGEEGLLGLAFHPEAAHPQAQARSVFLHYSVTAPGFGGIKDQNHRRGRLSRFELSPDGWSINRASEEILLEVDQPEPNHNGGMVAFGKDGMLYMGLGDGGGSGDRHGALGNGQNPGVLLGKILRLDVDHRDAAKGLAYAIPVDNPFAWKPGFRGEIWALGLRNPWRFSFDAQTGELWCGDVGQNKEEEVDVITKGGNYGWRIREATLPFAGGEKPATLPLIEPVAHHGRNEAMSVTGGYVYRGQAIPALRGWYVYGDFVTGNLWALRQNPTRDGAGLEGPVKLPFKLPPSSLSSFGEDEAGEIYMCSFDGSIYRFMEDQTKH